MALDTLQQGILDACAVWADAHPCLKAIYIFGSIARGDCCRDSDVDIFVEVKIDTENHASVEDFTRLHGEADGFSVTLGGAVRHPVHIHGMKTGEQTDLCVARHSSGKQVSGRRSAQGDTCCHS